MVLLERPMIEDFDDPDYDPFASDAANFGDAADPYAIIAALREAGPIHPGSYRALMGLPDALMPDRLFFTLVGTSEIAWALTDESSFSNAGYAFNIGVTFGRSISTMDNPEHGGFRRIFQRIFLPQRVRTWGETIVDPVVDTLMAEFLPLGRADLIGQFTLRYPFEVIYRQLALPADDVRVFQRLAIGQTDYVHGDKAKEAARKLGDYFRRIVDMRRAAPGDDLISLLANTEVDGEYLPEDVLISFLRQLMNAAGDTTYRATSVLLVALLQEPERFARICADRTLVAPAIEEALRWDGPVAVQLRMAKRDLTIGGVEVPAGSLVDVVAGAANRDPAAYADPNRFDMDRPKCPHFAFARGPHICLGQHLARVEMERALNALCDRLHNLRLDPDAAPPQIRGTMMRVPETLHVRFDAVS
jgi:cytochrome P450